MPVAPRHQELWERIAAHRFDDPAARLTFTARLARESGWTIGRAVRVVEEYRRFVFLAVTAGHAVTPSEDVDQAWHLHLVYTRDYWHTFCRDALGTPLHHGPTRGGPAEAVRYDEHYRRTLAAYSAAFDAPPPPDIWPPTDRRFGDDLAWRRVNVARNWVIPKPAWLTARPRSRAAGIAALAVVPILAAGIPSPLDLKAEPFLALYAALATAALVAGIVLRQAFVPEGDPAVDPGDVEPLEVALLADDGRFRFAATGLALLTGAPAPTATPSGGAAAAPLALASAPPPGASRLLADLHARLAALGACTPIEALKAAVDTAREEAEPWLVERGLLVGPWWSTSRPWIILTPLFATLGLGLAKICVGISRGKPVGFLVLGSIVLAVVGFLLLARNPRRTRRGDAVVRAAWARFRSSGAQDAWRANKTADLLPLAVALLGTTTLAGTAHAFIDKAVNALRPGSNGGGCDTGGDGGGGDGGCGGCGGCGGGGD